MRETRSRGYQDGSLVGANGAPRPDEQPLDDWLGDISDDDWGETAAQRAERRRATPAYEELPASERDLWRDDTADRPPPAPPVTAAETHRAVIERRRLVAGLVIVVGIALAAVVSVLLLRGDDETPVTSTPTVATPTPPPAATETSPSPPPSAPETDTSTTPTTTTPSTGDAAAFTLPEGTKLRRGEGDPGVVEDLQQALTDAGYDPGPADGNFGRGTEAAVVAFQEDNGLAADGVVGPETAAALNAALAGG